MLVKLTPDDYLVFLDQLLLFCAARCPEEAPHVQLDVEGRVPGQQLPLVVLG
jgi:hypothetical protein